jgi:hypothetical protein
MMSRIGGGDGDCKMNRFDEIKGKIEFSKNRIPSSPRLEEKQVTFQNSVTDAYMFCHSLPEPDYFPVIIRAEGTICRIVESSQDKPSVVEAVANEEQEKVWQIIKANFPKLNA